MFIECLSLAGWDIDFNRSKDTRLKLINKLPKDKETKAIIDFCNKKILDTNQ